EREATRKHTEIIGSISHEKNLLEKKIDELRTFEREYRTHLTTYLDSQLRELDRRGSVVPADAVGNPHGFVAAELGGHVDTGSHRGPDPKITTVDAGAGVARFSARSGPPDTRINDEPGMSGIQWKPAVELDYVGFREVIKQSG
ncbi:MAG: hypothetical protein WBL53_01310, partial [Pseudonocardiaceae bacterium]